MFTVCDRQCGTTGLCGTVPRKDRDLRNDLLSHAFIRVSLQFQTYHFSISWSRLLPTGRSLEADESAIDFYDNVIQSLVSSGIQPVVSTIKTVRSPLHSKKHAQTSVIPRSLCTTGTRRPSSRAAGSTQAFPTTSWTTLRLRSPCSATG